MIAIQFSKTNQKIIYLLSSLSKKKSLNRKLLTITMTFHLNIANTPVHIYFIPFTSSMTYYRRVFFYYILILLTSPRSPLAPSLSLSPASASCCASFIRCYGGPNFFSSPFSTTMICFFAFALPPSTLSSLYGGLITTLWRHGR